MKPIKPPKWFLQIFAMAIGIVLWSGSFGGIVDVFGNPPSSNKAPLSLETLRDLIGNPTVHENQYRETHFSRVLEVPLTSQGKLSFSPPTRLEKLVLIPHRERYVILENTLIWEDLESEDSRELTLEDYPMLASFVEGIRGIFTGDISTLQSLFFLELSGSKEDWILTMTPRDLEVQKFVEALKVIGRYGDITSIETREASGDHSILSILTEGK